MKARLKKKVGKVLRNNFVLNPTTPRQIMRMYYSASKLCRKLSYNIKRYAITESGEFVEVTASQEYNPFGFETTMWWATRYGRLYHSDELTFISK